MRVPHFIRGAVFAPILIVLVLMLKAACPSDAGAACFADYMAIPVFLPLILLYKIFGYGFLFRYELLFIISYWSFIGALVGFVFDIRRWGNKTEEISQAVTQ